MSNPFVGQIISVGFNFAPIGWAFCNGQLLAISNFNALFTLIGTTYGGDGQTTFALPNLCGRVPVNQGQGPGLSPYALGQNAGTETVTLTTNQIPQHNHTVNVTSSAGTTNVPSGSTYLSDTGPGTPVILSYTAFANAQALTPSTIAPTGGNLPHENQQPYLCINYIICLDGIFPSPN